ncbi:hypothetical protein bpr_II020 (plasmid) [Butyrivibrio proteoclasticus B316]|uniref:Uncharacterized protein n=1 Tax=Butyrivibrio proteoclasticus (strain ATCC 51982 / DSM 14932 / B316) TaxID=515622 RepID=E0S3H9_BUTPB|nr:hypothetical protein [Butyrivibrio proteoclasticus]ADL35961.1 hypothetical protein bpr_II020 [Butyrivibrio proteoclasticus B316]
MQTKALKRYRRLDCLHRGSIIFIGILLTMVIISAMNLWTKYILGIRLAYAYYWLLFIGVSGIIGTLIYYDLNQDLANTKLFRRQYKQMCTDIVKEFEFNLSTCAHFPSTDNFAEFVYYMEDFEKGLRLDAVNPTTGIRGIDEFRQRVKNQGWFFLKNTTILKIVTLYINNDVKPYLDLPKIPGVISLGATYNSEKYKKLKAWIERDSETRTAFDLVIRILNCKKVLSEVFKREVRRYFMDIDNRDMPTRREKANRMRFDFAPELYIRQQDEQLFLEQMIKEYKEREALKEHKQDM